MRFKASKYTAENIKKNSIPQIVFHWFILFGFIFELPIWGFITSRRLCTVYAICILFIKSKATKRVLQLFKKSNLLYAAILFAFCSSICAINNIGLERIETNIYYEVHYFLFQILYIVVWGIFCVVEFKDVMYFAKIFVSIMIFQSLIAYIALVNKPFRMFVYNNLYFSATDFSSMIEWGTRVVGIDLAGSLGSVILFTGCAVLLYVRLTERISVNQFIISYMIILVASFFIGRTGFYLSLAFLLLYFFLEKNFIKKMVSFVVIGILAIIVLQALLSQVSPDIAKLLVSWATELFNANTRFDTFDAIAEMEVPKFSQEMIFGTNVYRGRTPLGQIMDSDSGYAKLYCSIGVIGAICYYLSYVILFFSIKIKRKKVIKWFFMALIAVAFVIEYKEPYFHKYIYAFSTMTLLLFNAAEESKYGNNKEKEKNFGKI
ncbi:MAG: hypothetical protein IJE49_05075 [Agathobacter sp.]|nr:hypothetical protein [Agathobacter sp.]